MPAITIREYHPESGALLNNATVLDFGVITAGTTSRVKVIDIAFSEVSTVSNIKLGIISSGGLTVNPDPEDVADDGSASNGFFGIESSSAFSATKASQSLGRHFAGINTTALIGDSNNVSIGNKTSTISDYIYLDLEIGAANNNTGNGAWKVFFDYS
jgi:hypothetical protein